MIDPITFAVIKAGLDTIVDDMAYVVMRTARSSIVRDVLDYSVTICDRRGRILAQAKTVALHLGAVPDAMDVVLAQFENDLHPGDVIVLNDPYAGGMHLPDIFMIRPVFAETYLLGFAVVIAHHCDMGGRVPGSNASNSAKKMFRRGSASRPSSSTRAANPTGPCSRSSPATSACPTSFSATLMHSTPPAFSASANCCACGLAMARRSSPASIAARLWQIADPKGDPRLAGRGLRFH